MAEEFPSTERNRNLWAPWRMEYISALADGEGDCFLCRYRHQPEKDAEHLVVWRGQHSFVVMNRFPYTSGHLLIAPLDHLSTLRELSQSLMAELMMALRDAQDLLAEVVKPDGFNVGINFGRCAGAGLPGHLHLHIVPRWEGDTNFMSVVGDVRVIPQSLEAMYTALAEGAARLGLPKTL